ncbi:hypothetical protein OTU49_014660 [Cherax quadricarinatus]|uniref:DZIP3-like HEPN domain-containing protein n=1 Tax=Cherax quadricarinatus TaxID=27406 RepID=A0AAW0VNK9_CHEQU
MAFTGPSGDNRLNYARHSRFIRTIGQSIMYQAYLWLYQGGSLTLFQYLNSLPKGLNGLEKHTVDDIKAERDLTNMDITSLYKVMQRACGLSIEDRAWYTKPKSEKDTTLEQALHQLKLERNKLLHKDPTTFIKVSDSELDSAMALLKTLYRNILVLAAEKGKVEPNTLKVAITKMEEDLRQERYSESGITESEFLKISVQDLTEKNQEEGLESFPSEYVEVRLSKENQDISPSQIPLKDLLVQTCKEGDKPQVMVVVGETGAGKTSLCQ